MNEDEALAVLYANLKGSKRNKPSDWMIIAEACRFLKMKYGSYREVAKRFRANDRMIGQIDKLNDLNKDVKQLLRQRKLVLDEGLWIGRLPLERQSEVAKLVSDLPSKAVRVLVDRLLRNPRMSAEEAKRSLIDSGTVRKKIHVVVLPLSDEVFELLKWKAQKSHQKIHDYARRVLENRLRARSTR